MPTILTIWGLICTLQGILALDAHQVFANHGPIGLVTNYAGLICARAFLGLVEGPMFPGIVLYLSGFYTRKELSLRYLDAILNPCWTILIYIRQELRCSSQLPRFPERSRDFLRLL